MQDEIARLKAIVEQQRKALEKIKKISGDGGYTKGRQTIHVIAEEALAATPQCTQTDKQVDGCNLLQSAREAKKEVDSWEPWQKDAMGVSNE